MLFYFLLLLPWLITLISTMRNNHCMFSSSICLILGGGCSVLFDLAMLLGRFLT